MIELEVGVDIGFGIHVEVKIEVEIELEVPIEGDVENTVVRCSFVSHVCLSVAFDLFLLFCLGFYEPPSGNQIGGLPLAFSEFDI